jgi:NADP-dependent 3-hydroxy acid dehydrogenase YdfG
MATSLSVESATDGVLAGTHVSCGRALVTGVSSGLGGETVRARSDSGAFVAGTGRRRIV